MTTDTKQSYRIKLGPVASDLLDGLADQTPATLDSKIIELLHTAKRIEQLEAERGDMMVRNSVLADHILTVADALETTSVSITTLTNLVDHRTREFEKLLLHISTLVGTHMTDGDERERLHHRFHEMAREMSKQLDSLSTLVKDQHQQRQRQVQQAVGRADEERLTIVEKDVTISKAHDPRSGMER
jgi:hypothetical protein